MTDDPIIINFDNQTCWAVTLVVCVTIISVMVAWTQVRKAEEQVKLMLAGSYCEIPVGDLEHGDVSD